MKLPTNPIPRDELLARLDGYRAHDVDWRAGRTWGYVYDAGPEVEALAREAAGRFLFENALDPTVFPSLLRLENEVVSIVASNLGGDERTVGSFTSGGTESVLLAVQTARDLARSRRPALRDPEIVLPATAHAAFHKAAHYFGLRPVVVPVDPVTFRADVAATERAITDRTVLLVGSAPSYGQGVIDPIAELAALARARDLPFHVDACVGGWVLPYLRRAGADVPAFDLSVPGVTSLSVDLHKFGYAPKGASVLLYRSKELRRHAVFTHAQWSGYSFVNTTLQSSRSGAPIAAAWAVLHGIGDAGYARLGRELLQAMRRLVAGIEAIPGLRILGRPDATLLAFSTAEGGPAGAGSAGEGHSGTSRSEVPHSTRERAQRATECGIFNVMDEMKARGWYVQPQQGRDGTPPSVHLTLSPANVPWLSEFLSDLGASAEVARSLPSGHVRAALEGLDPRTPVDVGALLGLAGVVGTTLPDRMAPVHEALGALPPPASERVLGDFVNELYAAPAR